MPQHGDAFLLQLPGQRMAFIFHPSALHSFFTAPESQIAFQPAVVHFTERVFGMPSGAQRESTWSSAKPRACLKTSLLPIYIPTGYDTIEALNLNLT